MSQLVEIWYLILINCVGLALFGYDKSAAKKSSFRVPEYLLFFIAFIGASPAIIIGMKLFRHKTQKNSFKLWLVAVVGVQVVLLQQCFG